MLVLLNPNKPNQT